MTITEASLKAAIEAALAIEIGVTYPQSAAGLADYHDVIAGGVADGVFAQYGAGSTAESLHWSPSGAGAIVGAATVRLTVDESVLVRSKGSAPGRLVQAMVPVLAMTLRDSTPASSVVVIVIVTDWPSVRSNAAAETVRVPST